MKKIVFGVASAIAALSTLAISNLPTVAQGAENCKVIRMGFNPAQDATKVLASAKPIANYLEETIRGVEVKATVAQDYRGLIEAMRSGQLDFAWLNPVGYVDAAKEGIANVLLKSSREGGPYYWSAFIVRSDSRFRTLQDLQGSSIAWVDPNSAAGYTFPKATLIANKLDADKLFAKLEREYGIRHLDAEPRNITYDDKLGCFCIIDFELAEILPPPPGLIPPTL